MINKFCKILSKLVIIFIVLSKTVYAEAPIYELFGKKIIFNSESNTISAEGEASAIDKSGKKIFSNKIIYNKAKSIIITDSKSIYLDEAGNTLKADKFIYDINLKIIKARNNVEFTDKNGNKLNFTELDYNENTEKGIGKNFNGVLTDNSNFEGKIAEFDNKLEILIIGENKEENIFQKMFDILSPKPNAYTPCENKDKIKSTIKERCPDWSVETTETIHDRKNKIVKHYGSIIKIKNIPVFYTPYFSHPDPSVKRKSGFLPPSLKKFTDLGQTIKIPYFYAIDNSKDLTFTPIYYFDEKSLFLAEYRQQNLKSKFYLDTSFTQGYKKLNKIDANGNEINRTDGSRNHFFFNFLGSYDDLIFNKNDLEINLQRISQKNYLNVNQINTLNVKQDITNLNNNIILNSYEKNKKLTIRSDIFENLNIEDRNTKYQYTFPSIEFSNFKDIFDQNINFLNTFSAQNKGGDSNKMFQINKIETTSKSKQFSIFESVSNVFKTSINNINYYNDEIFNEKENLNSDLFLTAAVESALPLIKIQKNTSEILTPKAFTKFTSGSMTNSRNDNKIINPADIFSMNRMNNITNPETGASLGYGVEYERKIKDKENNIKTKGTFFIGQVLRLEKLDEMPSNSTLDDTKSAYVGNIKLNHKIGEKVMDKSNNYLNVNYDYIISKNLDKMLKTSIGSELNISNKLFSANYYKTSEIEDNHYLNLKYTQKIDNDFTVSFGGKKNIKDNFTENNYIEANYETDCIKIGLNMSKTFYQNEELKRSNNLTLQIVFKPFGSPVSPNLSNFLN